jgi:flagellar motor switch protein FliN
VSVSAAPSLSLGFREYYQVWSDSIRQVLGQVGNAPFTVKILSLDEGEGDLGTQPEAGIWFRFLAEKHLQGEQALLVSRLDGLRLANLLMGEPLDETAQFNEAHADAVAELLRQTAGAAAIALGTKRGGEVGLAFKGADRPEWRAATHGVLLCNSAQVPPVSIHLFLSPELTAAIDSASVETVVPRRDSRQPQNPPGNDERPAIDIDFLRGVGCDVSLRFGGRQMLLRDVLDLGRGGIIELDHQVQDPVELLVGRKVVARGLIVIVDGNYGLRVTEIASPEDRIEFLRQ